MADTIVIAKVEIEFDKAVKDTAELKKKQVELKKEIQLLKKSNKEGTAEFVKANAQLQANGQQLKTNEKQLRNLVAEENNQIGTLQKLRNANAGLRKEQEKLDLTTKQGQIRNKEINKGIDANTAALAKNSDQNVKNKINVGNYANGLQGSIPIVGTAANAARNLGVAFKIMLGPIGFVVAAVAAMVTYLKRGEEGQNKWSKMVAVATVVLENFLDIVGSVGEFLVNAFTQPKKTLEEFNSWIDNVGAWFKNTFGDVIGGSIDVFVAWLEKAFANVGLAWEKLQDVFVDNSEGITEAQDKIAQKDKEIEEGQARVAKGVKTVKAEAVDAYNAVAGAIDGVVQETEKEIKATMRLQDQQAQLRKTERVYKVQNAKDLKEINLLRENAAQYDIYTAAERLAFTDAAIAKQNEIMQREKDVATQKLQIHREEIAMSKSDIEALDKLAQLEADLINVEASNAKKRRKFQSERQTAINQNIADNKALAEKAISDYEYELKIWRLNNKSKIEDSKFLTQALLNEELSRIEKIAAQDNEILQQQYEAKLITQQEYELQKRTLELENLQTTTDLKEQFRLEQKAIEDERLIIDSENEKLLAEEKLFGKLEFEKEALELSYQQEMQAAQKVGADTTKIEEKYSKARRVINEAELQAKLSLAGSFAQNIANIAGEQTKAGKYAAAAATTISTIQGAVASYTGMVTAIPGPVGIAAGAVAAAAALVSGYANVKKILAVNPAATSTPSTATTPSVSTGVSSSSSSESVEASQAEIGQGITSRDISDQIENSTTNTVLVVDEVTAAQESEDLRDETSIL